MPKVDRTEHSCFYSHAFRAVQGVAVLLPSPSLFAKPPRQHTASGPCLRAMGGPRKRLLASGRLRLARLLVDGQILMQPSPMICFLVFSLSSVGWSYV